MIVGGGHALADQYRVRSRAGVVFDLDRAEYAGFRHLDDVIGQIGREFVVFVHVHLEVLQVARVDADHLGTGLAGAFDLFAGVRLHQHGHAELVRQVEQVLELGVVQCGDDEQHQVGAVGAGLEDLVVGDDEVLAQHWNVHGGADLVEIVKAAEEFAAFGEHGDGACAALLVLAGQRGRVRDVGQVALGRRRALDLGNHGDAVGALKPSCRVNRSRGRQRGLLHILKRYGELTGALILQRSRHQFVQNRHGPPFVGVRSCATLGHVLSRLPNPSYILGFRRRFRLRQNIGINWHACADVSRSTWNGTPWLDRTIDGASLLAGVRNSGTALSRRLQFHEVAPLQGDGKRLIQPLDSTEPMRLF